MNKIISTNPLFSIMIALLFTFHGSAQQNTQVRKQVIKGWEVETGYFFNGQPYSKVGSGNKILIQLEELSFNHKPPEGFILKLFVKQNEMFYDDYTVYRIGRKPNLPDGYSINDMSKDYGTLISGSFKDKVDIVGASTGGQIGLCLAANYPQLINKIVIISAAYKVSEEGQILEKKAAEYFAQEKYGKTMATIMDVVYDKGIKRSFYKLIMRIMGSSMLKNVEYTNDFQVGVMADCTMDFKNRLQEIETPTLIITGEKDIGYSFEDVKITAAGISNSKLISYSNYGHDLFTDNHKEVNTNIIDFLSQDQ